MNEPTKKKVIAIFDSGIGGLTALKEMLNLNVKGNFVYVADNKHSPYGSRTEQEIITYVIDTFKKLSKLYNITSIIFACNTASVYAKNIVEELFGIPVYSVTDEAISFINSSYLRGTIDVLSTKMTAKSHYYKNQIRNNHVRELACPSFVPFVESGITSTSLKRELVYNELIGRQTENCRHILLGCTHYPFLADEIQDLYGDKTFVINPSKLLAFKMQNKLKSDQEMNHNYENISFYVTENNTKFDTIASDYLNINVKSMVLNKTQEIENIRFQAKGSIYEAL